jgi:hypothetical protein
MKKQKKDKQTNKKDPVVKECIDQYQADFDEMKATRDTWEDKEALIISVNTDSYTSKVGKSDVHSPELQNAIIKRTNNTMAQLPTGKVQALSKKDAGKNIMMNYILTKYILPNANTLRPIYTKAWQMEFYSLVYGSFPVLVDYIISDRYVGPDFYPIPVRNLVPQRGRYAIDDCDRVFVRSLVSKQWLESKKDQKGWKNIDKVVDAVKNVEKDQETTSYIEDESMTRGAYDNEQIEVITRYEADRWVVFSRDANTVLRDVPNPHDNDLLPIVIKDAFPLIDRFYGLVKYDRGMSLQMSLNSLVNLYFDGVKMSIFPPLKIYYPDVIARTIVNEPGAKYVLRNMNPDAVTEMQRSPRGMDTFIQTYQFLKSSIMNITNTTDTAISSDVDIQQGKTPAAIKFQKAMDASRTNFDRKQLEISMEQIFERFINLIAKKQEKPIKMHLAEEDLNIIGQYNPDVVEMFESGKYGEVTVKPSDIKNSEYRFFIDSGTTMKADEALEHETLAVTLDMIMKIPGAAEQMMQSGKVILGDVSIDAGELIKRSIITSGIQDWEKIVGEVQPEDMPVNFEQAPAQAALSGMGQQMPPMAGMPMPPAQGVPMGQPMPPMGQQPMPQQPMPMPQQQGQPGYSVEQLAADLQSAGKQV